MSLFPTETLIIHEISVTRKHSKWTGHTVISWVGVNSFICNDCVPQTLLWGRFSRDLIKFPGKNWQLECLRTDVIATKNGSSKWNCFKSPNISQKFINSNSSCAFHLLFPIHWFHECFHGNQGNFQVTPNFWTVVYCLFLIVVVIHILLKATAI